MNNIMITGATGFIGSHLIYELINNEYNVAILCRKESKLDKFKNIINKIKVYKVDDNINKIIIVITRATSVIPFVFFIISILSFVNYIFYYILILL